MSNPTIEAPKDITEIRELKPSGEIKTRVRQNYDDGRDKKWLMWLGVIIFTTAIFILWGWNLVVKIQDSAKIDDLGIIKGVKEDVEEILDNPSEKINLDTAIIKEGQEEDQKENLKEKIKQNIANIITAFETSTTTTGTEIAEEDVILNTDTLDEKTTEENNEIITPSL